MSGSDRKKQMRMSALTSDLPFVAYGFWIKEGRVLVQSLQAPGAPAAFSVI